MIFAKCPNSRASAIEIRQVIVAQPLSSSLDRSYTIVRGRRQSGFPMYRLSAHSPLGLVATDPSGEEMVIKPQERPQRHTDVVALRPRRIGLRLLHPTALLRVPVVVLDRARPLGHMLMVVLAHPLVAGRPVVIAAVKGDRLGDADGVVADQSGRRAGGDILVIRKRQDATALGIDLAVGLEPGQPPPALVADLLEVLQADIPAVEEDRTRGKPSTLGDEHHLPEWIVHGPDVGFVVDAEVNQDLAPVVRCRNRF